MKKIILCSFLILSILSCKTEKNENPTEIVNETKNDTLVTESWTNQQIVDSLKKGDYSKEMGKYSDAVLNEIAKEMKYTNQNNEEYLKEIMDVKNDIITLYWDFGTGASMNHQKLQIIDNRVVNLGNGFDQLSEIETKKLEAAIQSKIKNYMHFSGRNEAKISVLENGNYKISFGALTEDDAEATGGSIQIIYETKDLKTYIPSSLKIEKI